MELTDTAKKKKELRKLGTVKLQGKDYLQVAHRVLIFRQEHPDWSIMTEFQMCGEVPAMFCTISDNEGRIIAQAHKSVQKGGRGPAAKYPLEMAETGAMGRALASCGYGTLSGDLDEGDQIADAPQDMSKRNW